MGVKNLTEPGRYSDGEGLILKLAAKGKGSWIVRIQANGKRRDIGLGTLADLPLGEAREAARALRKEMKAGIDVLAEREKEALVIPSFRDAAKLVHEEHKAAWKNGKHQAQWINTLKTYVFSKFGAKPIDELTKQDIVDAIGPIWKSKAETASRTLQRIRLVFNFAAAVSLLLFLVSAGLWVRSYFVFDGWWRCDGYLGCVPLDGDR